MQIRRNSARGAVAAVAISLAAQAHAAPAPPAHVFFDNPAMDQPVMSPDGDFLAVLLRTQAGRRELAVVDLVDLKQVQVAAGFSDADVSSAEWVNDRRLVFHTWNEGDSAADQTGSGLFAVDRDGGDLRRLIAPHREFLTTNDAPGVVSRELSPDHVLLRTLADGSDDVLIEHLSYRQFGTGDAHYHIEIDNRTPLRLDTRSGRVHSVLPAPLPAHATEWFFDEGGRALGVETDSDGQTAVLVPDGTGGWKERVHFPSFSDELQAGYRLAAVTTDGSVYVERYTGGTDNALGLYRLDLQTGRTEPRPTVSLKGFDFSGEFVEDRREHRVLGVHYVADAAGTAWFDPAMAALQAKVDARLPGLINRIDPASCGCAKRVLVSSHSDRQPDLFFLYDRALDALIPVGAARPGIDRSRMARTDFYRIRARDGAEIPLYVTRPHGTGPWPTVVLVHGGPQVRGWNWAWDPESQFLAARGYLVVKPEYRGSWGYGWRLLRSGFRQRGLKSQDDIADATRWAAAQGLEDPRRTCIAGASYGGYATLMGLVRYGDLYQCGVAWAAVADIQMMYDTWWSDMDDEWKGYGMPVMIGDPVKDAGQLAQTSPLRQAARITRPLLLAHGGVDRRVPVEQADAMREALLAHHAPLTWILYPDEAHGWYKPETRAAFHDAMAAFLDAHIGAAAPAPVPAAAASAP